MGILRFVFALFVVLGHLCMETAFLTHWGAFAVTGFYIISGFLITRVLVKIYDFHFIPFFVNRFLRLFPMYYLVAAITLLAIGCVFENAAQYHAAYAIKTRFMDLWGNLFLFPFEFYDKSFRLVPPTWSVGVELIGYFSLWLFIARSRRTVWISLVLTTAIHAAIYFVWNGGWVQSYAPAYAALLPFSLGSAIYHLGPWPTLGKYFYWIAGGFLANLLWVGHGGGLEYRWFQQFFYLNMALAFLLVAALPTRTSKWDRILGDFAYPVFLVHWLCGLVMSRVLALPVRGGELLLASLPLVFLSALALVQLQASVVERWRDGIRSGITTRR